MRTSDQINELAAAMAKAQGALKPAVKDALNPHYQSKYADIASVWDVCRNALPPNGLTVWQDVTNAESSIAVTTRIIHVSGQWVEFGPLIVPVIKQDAHGVGSACSYGKRYSLSAAVGVVAEEEDDDGNASTGDASRHTEHIERGACSTTRNQTPQSGEPPMPRPIGDFGYGKKFVSTPWNLLAFSQLEWFRDQPHTPKIIRDKCNAEMAWRTYELAKLDAMKKQDAERNEPDFTDDDIPM